MRSWTWIALSLLVISCGGPPQRELSEVDLAMKEAVLAQRCAPEEYAAAQRMQQKANQLSKDGKYDEAKVTAIAAKKLYEEAQKKAAARREECFKPKNGVEPKGVKAFLEEDKNAAALDATAGRGLQTVFFDFNAFEVNASNREVLNHNAQWINARPDKKITLSGHADERGSSEYNLALGEKRALVVKRYLITLGVNGDRLRTMSFGEEMPLELGNNEAAHAHNRRVELASN
ncbi:OmpA family protein [Myxococcota bacterium]|nr:OmpA family protein [Myxococcota bacterium]MBU1431439.1 OmpA family protein [Myxococcota bacterium]MBU1899116.1 OmpA family protein [Myxococcota bacterium]